MSRLVFVEVANSNPATALMSPKKINNFLRPSLASKKPAPRLNMVELSKPPVSTNPIWDMVKPRVLR